MEIQNTNNQNSVHVAPASPSQPLTQTANQSTKDPQGKSNFPLLIMGFLLIFLVGCVSGIVFAKNKTIDGLTTFFIKPTPTIAAKPQPTDTPTPTITPSPTPIPSKTGVLTFPTANSTLCISQNYSVAWTAPNDTQNIALEVIPPSGLPHRITNSTNPGALDNTDNLIKGTYVWSAGKNIDEVSLPSGPGYRLALIVFGPSTASYETFGSFFTLTTCAR